MVISIVSPELEYCVPGIGVMPLIKFSFLISLCLSIYGCSTNPDDISSDFTNCWIAEKIDEDRIKIDDTKFIYLKPHTVLIPSNLCDKKVIRVIEFSDNATEYLNRVSYRDFDGIKGYQGSIVINYIRNGTRNIYEVKLESLSIINRLDKNASNFILERSRL